MAITTEISQVIYKKAQGEVFVWLDALHHHDANPESIIKSGSNKMFADALSKIVSVHVKYTASWFEPTKQDVAIRSDLLSLTEHRAELIKVLTDIGVQENTASDLIDQYLTSVCSDS